MTSGHFTTVILSGLLLAGCQSAHQASNNPTAQPARGGSTSSMPSGNKNGTDMSDMGRASNQAVYHARGQVVSVNASGSGPSMTVDHEDIPGFMEAMRMTFAASDAVQLAHVTAGQKVSFDLACQSNGSYAVQNIQPLPANTPLKLASPPAAMP